MFGHLVPCGGGKAVALSKTRLVLGRRVTGAEGTPVASHDVELRLIDGWWHVRRIASDQTLTVNGNPCDATRLSPNDVLSVSGKFYRIAFQPPEPAAPRAPATPVPAAVREPETPRPSLALGMLIPCGGGPSIALRRPSFVIGRSPACDLVIPQKSVSSRHCSLNLTEGYWQMTDLDSTNGTTIDGMRYLKKWVLPGSVLGVPGKRYRLEYQPKGDQPSLSQDDEVVLPHRSLLEMAGISKSGMDRLMDSLPVNEPSRPRWKLDGSDD